MRIHQGYSQIPAASGVRRPSTTYFPHSPGATHRILGEIRLSRLDMVHNRHRLRCRRGTEGPEHEAPSAPMKGPPGGSPLGYRSGCDVSDYNVVVCCISLSAVDWAIDVSFIN